MVPDDLVIDPVFKMRSRFTPDGDAVLVETWVDPGGGVTPHIHPTMTERFEVLEGTCEFLSGRRWTAYGPGERATIEPGTRHAFRNRSGAVTRFVCRASPPETLEAFLTDAAALSRSGGITKHALPKSFTALLQAAVMMDAYGDSVHMLAPLPPQPVQKLLFPPLARLGRKRGHHAGSIAR